VDFLTQGNFWLGLILGVFVAFIIIDKVIKTNAAGRKFEREQNESAMRGAKSIIDSYEQTIDELNSTNAKLRKQIHNLKRDNK